MPLSQIIALAALRPLQEDTVLAPFWHRAADDWQLETSFLRPPSPCHAGSQDRTAKVWRLPDLVPVLTLRGHRRGVWSVEFSPVEQALLTSSGGWASLGVPCRKIAWAGGVHRLPHGPVGAVHRWRNRSRMVGAGWWVPGG